MRARRALIPAAVLAAAFLATAAAPAGEDPLRIPMFETVVSGREVRVETRLAPGLPPDVRTRLASGLPTTVIWEVRLYVSRRNWWDGLEDERRYDVTATYRPMRDDFALERRLDGRLLETVVVPGREEAERALGTLPGLPCFTIGSHLAAKPLVVRVRCVYGTGMVLGFVPTRSMTGWRRSTVFSWRAEGAAP